MDCSGSGAVPVRDRLRHRGAGLSPASASAPRASGLPSRRRQNLCQPAGFWLRALSSRGCRAKEAQHGAARPATKGDRRCAAVAGRAWHSRPGGQCDSGSRCNQRRILPAMGGGSGAVGPSHPTPRLTRHASWRPGVRARALHRRAVDSRGGRTSEYDMTGDYSVA
jgi:hypothetical protein